MRKLGEIIKDINIVKYTLGLRVVSKVTGFTGIIIGRAEYLYRNNKYLVSPRVNKFNEVGINHWIDEEELELVINENKPVEFINDEKSKK